ncbi:MAG: polyprenyl synthetase family protein [Acidithiobacillus sp.]|uniref:polyprenyl synthetase family protein n=1 Tax=Acidithiobacillus sp. TaxID=1872118 RepID=UPI0025856608|nr:polyprenyl synthetase family protein [Acidithiobacillus sp.]MCE5421161.1 polyprenyl synthetase family protein [Acidithiobacillus sp.]
MRDPECNYHLRLVESRMLELVNDDTCAEVGRIAAAHLCAGGSRVRARLALAASAALELPQEFAVSIATACELLHNASLVHDDLQDRDALRRGRLAIWREHDDATAICVGDLFLSAAYASVAACGGAASDLLIRMHTRVSAVIRGQAADLRLRGATTTLDDYEQVAAGKSGPLLSLPMELALLLAREDQYLPSAIRAGELFAVGYQVMDDLDDVDRDAVHEELNVVRVLIASGSPEPFMAAQALALTHFQQARAVALTLPRGSGTLLADYAAQRAQALQPLRVSA